MIPYFHCCKDCPERKVGCHATCETYLTAKQERNRQIEQVRQDNKGNIDVYKACKRARERKRRKHYDRKESEK